MTRTFSTREGLVPIQCTIDNDAPQAMRQEVVALFFDYAARVEAEGESWVPKWTEPEPRRVYEIVCGSLGLGIASEPSGTYHGKVSRAIAAAPWFRVYDLVERFASEYGRFEGFCDNIDQVLAAHGVVWELDSHGTLVRVLPPGPSACVLRRTTARFDRGSDVAPEASCPEYGARFPPSVQEGNVSELLQWTT